MDELEKMFEEQNKANDLFKKLQTTQSMSDVADIVDSMDEKMAKLVLKKFVYSRS